MQELRLVLRPIPSTTLGAVTVSMEEQIRDVLLKDTVPLHLVLLHDRYVRLDLSILDVILKIKLSVLV